jgi:single-stranded-DNA-specific exonuclease
MKWKFKSEKIIDSREPDSILKELLGIRGVADVDSFVAPSVSGLGDPFLLEGVREGAVAILEAIDKNKKISIYGDFDMDGIASTALLLLVLRKLGADADFYIPNRLEDGYGLSKEGIAFLKEKGAELIITVDCGINGAEAIEYARELGIDIIITDHHLPEGKNPASIVVDPHISDSYPFKDLSGVGVAFKLCQGLFVISGLSENFLLWNLDLVALGTVADVMPLSDENRILTALGLKILNEGRRPGIVSLLKNSRLKGGNIKAWHIAFIIAPRINALGRLDDAREAVELLITYDKNKADLIADKLEKHNSERKKLQDKTYKEALVFLDDIDTEKSSGIILSDKNWHEGVIGIVASKIVEEFNQPTILIAEKGSICKGSGRSVPGLNIIDCVNKLSDYLEKFGGHSGACGISIKRENIDLFREAFGKEVMKKLKGRVIEKELLIDFPLSITSVNEELIKNLEVMAPFGVGNAKPIFAALNVELAGSPKIVGRNHLKFAVREGSKYISCIGFSLGDKMDLLKSSEKFSIAYSPFIDDWNNQVSLKILDIKI